MTQIGKQFASLAESVVRIHGVNSTKMVEEYYIITETVKPNWKYKYGETSGAGNPELLDKLVEMGYVRKFVGTKRESNPRRNWRYRYEITPVYFGLTVKGWEVAEKYISAAYGKEEYNRIAKRG